MPRKISYSQNFEDIILARVFADVERGHYIDVGANHPKYDSVTKLFYENGWTGINIEPLEAEFKLLLADRPKDINLNICAGDHNGFIKFAHVKNRPGWSSSEPKQISKMLDDPELVTKVTEIQQQTLDHVINNLKFEVVHFLKIDVEGAELSVLRGLDLNRVRPWVILIEATEPGSDLEVHLQWEHLLISNGYHFVYSDGINRFYLCKNHLELLPKFNHPPNVFDDFIALTTYEAQFSLALTEEAHESTKRKNSELNIKLNMLEKQFSESQILANHLENKVNELKEELLEANAKLDSQEWELLTKSEELEKAIKVKNDILRSKSWKLTAPLRVFNKALNNLKIK